MVRPNPWRKTLANKFFLLDCSLLCANVYGMYEVPSTKYDNYPVSIYINSPYVNYVEK